MTSPSASLHPLAPSFPSRLRCSRSSSGCSGCRRRSGGPFWPWRPSAAAGTMSGPPWSTGYTGPAAGSGRGQGCDGDGGVGVSEGKARVQAGKHVGPAHGSTPALGPIPYGFRRLWSEIPPLGCLVGGGGAVGLSRQALAGRSAHSSGATPRWTPSTRRR